MLSTIAVVLIVLWLLGLVGGFVFGGAVHILLVVALIVFAYRLFSGRSVT